MHVIIVGCGRVGSSLASRLDGEGHSVAVVDRDPAAFNRLGTAFRGRTLSGVGFDRNVLSSAGVGQAEALAAVTSGDNSNILTARVARENFGVERVVARIYDPRRAAVYQRLGIATVATVSWTTDHVFRRLVPHHAAVEWVDPSTRVSVVERRIGADLAGRTYGDIEQALVARVVAYARLGAATVASADVVAQEGDLAYLAVASEAVDRLEELVSVATRAR